MNRYDPEVVQLHAERGKPGPRLVRGLLWAIFTMFLVFLLIFLFMLFTPAYSFDITNLI